MMEPMREPLSPQRQRPPVPSNRPTRYYGITSPGATPNTPATYAGTTQAPATLLAPPAAYQQQSNVLGRYDPSGAAPLVDPVGGSSSRRGSEDIGSAQKKSSHKALWILLAVLVGIGLIVGLAVGLTRHRGRSSSDVPAGDGAFGDHPPNVAPDAAPQVPESFKNSSSTGPVQVRFQILNQQDARQEQIDQSGNSIGFAPGSQPQMISVGGSVDFFVNLDPPEAVDTMTDVKIWFDDEDAAGTYRFSGTDPSQLQQYINSQLSVLTGDLPSGVHTLHCRMLFSDSSEPVFVNQEIYVLRQSIDITYFRLSSKFLAIGGKIVIQLETSVPISYVDSATINQVFPGADFNNAILSPVRNPNDTDNGGSRRFPKLFSQEFDLVAPRYRDVDSIGNMTEGSKVLEIQLHGSTTSGTGELDEFRFATLRIEFVFSFATRNPLTSPYGTSELGRLPPATIADDGTVVPPPATPDPNASAPPPPVDDLATLIDDPTDPDAALPAILPTPVDYSFPTVIGASPVGILAGNLSYVNITVRGVITADHQLLIGLSSYSGYLQIPLMKLVNDADVIAAASAAASTSHGGTTTALHSMSAERSRFHVESNGRSVVGSTFHAQPSGRPSEVASVARFHTESEESDAAYAVQPSTTILVPLTASKIDENPIASNFETMRTAVRSLSSNDISQYHASDASFSEPPSLGGLRVTLSWPTLTDVDLHVKDPLGGEVFYMQPQLDGGFLDVDSNADCQFDFINVEHIYYPAPVSGTYDFSAVLYNGCDVGGSPVVLTVDGCDVKQDTRSGSIGPTFGFSIDIHCDNQYILRGTILYEARDGLMGGTKVIRNGPAGPTLKVKEKDTGDLIGETEVKQDGSFELRLTIAPERSDLTHTITLEIESDQFVVKDYSDKAHVLTSVKDSDFVPKSFVQPGAPAGSTTLIERDLLFAFADKSGALAVFSALLPGWTYYNSIGYPLSDQVVAYWDLGQKAPSSSGANSLSYEREGELYIGGSTVDPDEFDESVILHELGHAFQFHYGPPLVGAPHGGINYIRPTLAFSEGLATYLGQRALNRRLYVDLGGGSSGAFRYDICDTRQWRQGTSNGKTTGKISEILVTCILWTLQHRQALEPALLHALTTEMKNAEGEKKGEAGFADLADMFALVGCALPGNAKAAFTQKISKRPFGLKWMTEPGFCVFT